MSDELDDLSDSELRARLEQRGYAEPALTHYIDNREDPEVAEALERILER